MPQSIPPKVDVFPVGANENIAKGDVLLMNDAGFMEVATAAASPKRKHFVAINAVNNTGGANGDKKVSVVGAGQRVTVQTKSILRPGQGIKVASTAGKVTAMVLTGMTPDDLNLRIGVFIGVEPGVYVKDTATPYAESFTDDSNPEVNAAVDQIVVVELE